MFLADSIEIKYRKCECDMLKIAQQWLLKRACTLSCGERFQLLNRCVRLLLKRSNSHGEINIFMFFVGSIAAPIWSREKTHAHTHAHKLSTGLALGHKSFNLSISYIRAYTWLTSVRTSTPSVFNYSWNFIGYIRKVSVAACVCARCVLPFLLSTRSERRKALSTYTTIGFYDRIKLKFMLCKVLQYKHTIRAARGEKKKCRTHASRSVLGVCSPRDLWFPRGEMASTRHGTHIQR